MVRLAYKWEFATHRCSTDENRGFAQRKQVVSHENALTVFQFFCCRCYLPMTQPQGPLPLVFFCSWVATAPLRIPSHITQDCPRQLVRNRGNLLRYKAAMRCPLLLLSSGPLWTSNAEQWDLQKSLIQATKMGVLPNRSCGLSNPKSKCSLAKEFWGGTRPIPANRRKDCTRGVGLLALQSSVNDTYHAIQRTSCH